MMFLLVCKDVAVVANSTTQMVASSLACFSRKSKRCCYKNIEPRKMITLLQKRVLAAGKVMAGNTFPYYAKYKNKKKSPKSLRDEALAVKIMSCKMSMF